MTELTSLDLLYFVLTFFVSIIGTLLTLVLLRLIKILGVGVELANYYWNIKKTISYYSYLPGVIRDKIFDYFSDTNSDTKDSR